MLPTGGPLQTQRHIQTESRRMEKDIPCKWKPKESWSGNPSFRQNKEYYKRQRRALHNNQEINPKRRHNNCKCLCTQYRNTSIHKTNTNRHKGEIGSNKTIVGDFNTPLSPMDRSSKQRINKETKTLNETLDKMDLIDIFRTFHQNTEQFLLKCIWNILQDRSHLGPQIKPQ